MEQQKTLTEQVIAEEPKTAEQIEKETMQQHLDAEQSQMADNLMAQFMPHFSEALYKLSNNELRKLIKILIQFPFVKVNKNTLNEKQKVAFMFGERIIYANMVKRAQAELIRTFGEVAKEQPEEEKKENEQQSEST